MPASIVLSVKEVKEGLYGTYEVEKTEQKYDDARSTFKSKEATKAGRNKYTGLFAVLLFGSFVIPMAQYFWCDIASARARSRARRARRGAARRPPRLTPRARARRSQVRPRRPRL